MCLDEKFTQDFTMANCGFLRNNFENKLENHTQCASINYIYLEWPNGLVMCFDFSKLIKRYKIQVLSADSGKIYISGRALCKLEKHS